MASDIFLYASVYITCRQSNSPLIKRVSHRVSSKPISRYQATAGFITGCSFSLLCPAISA
jgi:hypothetical protein